MWGAIAGMAMNLVNRKMDQYAQEDLTRDQIEGSKELSKFNQGLAIDTWERTGPAAQRQQLEKAGLNVGLMYQGSGPGGTTAQPAQVTRGQMPPTGGGLAMMLQAQQIQQQNKLVEAQARNLDADTANKTAENPAYQLQGTYLQTQIDALKQQTANTALAGVIMEFDKRIKEIDADIKSQTKEQAIGTITQNYEKTKAEAETAARDNRVAEKTLDWTLQGIQNTMLLQAAEIAFKDAQTKATQTGSYLKPIEVSTQMEKVKAEIENMRIGQRQKWEELTQKDWEIMLKEMATKFQFGDEATKIRWINTMLDAVKTFKK